MNVPDQYVNAIREVYRRPTFRVEMEGQISQWTKQTAGIRQGCPLSPYLFIVLMSVLFQDIHQGDKLKLHEHRVLGMETDEILYADDTICISEDEEALSRLLQAIEVEGGKYGLRLNTKNVNASTSAQPVKYTSPTGPRSQNSMKLSTSVAT